MTMSHAVSQQTLLDTLRDLMRLHAPGAALMAPLGGQVFQITADAAPQSLGAELLPPEEWLDDGELRWLNRDGALLGLLWSRSSVPEAASALINLMLRSVHRGGSEQDLNLLLTHLPTPVAWLDGELHFRQVSQHFLSLHGLTQEGVLGRGVAEVFPGRPALPELLDSALRGQAVHLPLECLSVRGAGLWLRGEARPFFDAQGIGVLWTTQDASQERLLARQLDSLLDDSSALLAVMDGSGRVQNASSALLNLMGVTQTEVLGMALWEWPCWEAGPQVRALVERAMGGEPASGELRVAHGGLLRLSIHGEGRAAGVLVAQGHDLAPLRDMQEQATLQRSLIQQILSRSSEATLLLNVAGKITLANQEAADLLGLEAAQLTGAGFERLLRDTGIGIFDVTGQQKLDLGAHLGRWAQGEGSGDLEVMLTSALGVRRTVRMQASVLPLLDGQRHGVMMTLRDISSVRRMEARLRHDTLHDGLTGLYNRAGLRARLSELGSAAQVSLLAVDISGFPALTVSLGRVPSDALLVQLAARLLNWRPQLLAARLSEDTFMLAIYHLPAPVSARPVGRPRKDAAVRAVQAGTDLAPGDQLEEYLHSLGHHLQAPFSVGGRELPLNFNLGATCGTVSHDPEALLGQAETALNFIGRPVHVTDARATDARAASSRNGRGGGMIYHDALRAEVARDFQLQSELPGALARGELRLSYQPLVSLPGPQGGPPRLLGAEALLRWNHPQLGLLAPPAFLPLAARSAVISDIGEWVMREALAARRSWKRAGGLQVSVNLSLDELLRQDDLERLFPLLEAHGAPDIELSADSLLHFSQRTLNLLTHLRELGANILIDDFGDGASSLTSLERFPINGVKLHPSFVARLDHPRAYQLLCGTAALAASLGLSVTAVGVETAQQLFLLEQAGVSAAQGYHFAPPLSAQELAEYYPPQRGESSS